MSDLEPKPPTRRKDHFYKTMTIPQGWNTENITTSHSNGKVSAFGSQPVTNTRPIATASSEALINRQLDPFPRPNTIPAGWDLSEQ